MTFADRLDKVSRGVSGLAQEIEALRQEWLASSPSAALPQAPPASAGASMEGLLTYLAVSPRVEDDALLNMILRCAMYVVSGGGAGLTLYDSEKKKLVFRAAIGDGAEGIVGYEVPLEGSRHGLAFATGEVQSATPLYSTIEAAAQTQFRNVLVAPLIVDGEGIGTMSAVNKQNGDHFTPHDMEAYKMFADLAAMVVRQRLREQTLQRLMQGESVNAPAQLQGLEFGEDAATLMGCVQDIWNLSQQRGDLLPVCRQMTAMLAELSRRQGQGY